jgi:hypothetical protein
MKSTCVAPANCPRAIVEGHTIHFAIELTNAIRNASQAVPAWLGVTKLRRGLERSRPVGRLIDMRAVQPQALFGFAFDGHPQGRR